MAKSEIDFVRARKQQKNEDILFYRNKGTEYEDEYYK